MTLDGVSGVLGGARSVVGGIGSIGGALRKMSQDVFYGLSNLQMLKDLAAKPIEIITSVVQANASRETAVLQFQTLLGSAEAAQAQIKELAAFAAATPFEMPEILTAARTLQTFGKSALNNRKVLTSVGDAAAGTGKSFEEVAYWTARMYGSLSSGQPFAEAINRMTEMGSIGPETAAALRKISDEGNGTVDTINLLFAGMDKEHAGGMKRLSASFSGMVSTMKDSWNEFKILVGGELFNAMKADLTALSADIDKAFKSGAIEKFATTVGSALRGAYDEVTNLLGGIKIGDLLAANDQGRLLAMLREQLGDSAEYFWETMMYHADKNGPNIGRAIFGDGVLSNLLGISNRDAFRAMAEEGGSKEMLQKTGLLDRAAIVAKQAWNNLGALGDAMMPGDQGYSYQSIEDAAAAHAAKNLQGLRTTKPVMDENKTLQMVREAAAVQQGPSFMQNLAAKLNEAYANMQQQTRANMEMVYGVSTGGGKGKVDLSSRLTDIAMAEKMQKTEAAMDRTAEAADKLNRALDAAVNQPALLYGR